MRIGNNLMLVICLMTPLFANAHRGLTRTECDAFIAKYKDLAIAEMHRSGVPASITIAQLIWESAWGQSTLATEANNFFGIKGERDWDGDCYYRKDDDLDENGNLRPSCFRVYPDAASSFADHSDFLTKGSRYTALFELDRTDYRAWAKGLKAAGYATFDAYAEKLIEKIEMYNLAQYDRMIQIDTFAEMPEESSAEGLFDYVPTTEESEVMAAPQPMLISTPVPNVEPNINTTVPMLEVQEIEIDKIPKNTVQGQHLIQPKKRRPNAHYRP